MAIKTEWPVEHSCGHQQDHDLSENRSSQRPPFARWLENKDCSECWRAAHDRQWRNERWAAEAAIIVSWDAQAAIPALEGCEKAVGWDARVRHQLMTACHRHIGGGDIRRQDCEERFEVPARTVTAASWWIDQRDTDPADMVELLADVFACTEAITADNGC